MNGGGHISENLEVSA